MKEKMSTFGFAIYPSTREEMQQLKDNAMVEDGGETRNMTWDEFLKEMIASYKEVHNEEKNQ